MKLLTITLAIFLIFSQPIFSQNTELWGMTLSGGEYGTGAIFNTDSAGNNISNAHSFYRNEGHHPYFGQFCEANNGKLYGLVPTGGYSDFGVLFEYDVLQNTYTRKISFDGISNGKFPYGSLLLASNGNLYGMTNYGGQYDKGVLFEFNPSTNIFQVKVEFDGISKGSLPLGSLAEGINGKLYGMTSAGGVYDKGVLFEFNPFGNVFVKKFDFDGVNGSTPQGSLMRSANGKFYGLTKFGGLYDKGVLFEYLPNSNLLTKKEDFIQSTMGSYPLGDLIETNSGELYGLASFGGTYNKGTIFKYNPVTEDLIQMVAFQGFANGSNPNGSLIKTTNNRIFGMTKTGGALNKGVLFEYFPDSTNCEVNIEFPNSGIFEEGQTPIGTLFEYSNGKLYGMLNSGGIMSSGVIFEYEPIINSYTKKLEFNFIPNGGGPYGSLMQSSSGKLYGLATFGGSKDDGVIFQYNPETMIYSKKMDLDGLVNGSRPEGHFVEANNGLLYGLTNNGGINNVGTLLKYDPSTNVLTKMVDFENLLKGQFPHGSLLKALNGKLYGLTRLGGLNNLGVLFEFDPNTEIFTKLYDFTGIQNGSEPLDALIQASNGKLYGLTNRGGTNLNGVIFEFDISSNSYTKLFDFNGVSSGKYPEGSLLEASTGKLYGLTFSGGLNDLGVLFEYDLSNSTYTKQFDFDGTINGSNPRGSLTESTNLNLYGLTFSGGANNQGVLFEYSPVNDVYIKKQDLGNGAGGKPFNTKLLKISTCRTLSQIDTAVCSSYISPSGQFITSTGVYGDTILNSYNCDSIITINLTIKSDSIVDFIFNCDSLTWQDGITYSANTNSPSILLTNNFGCDSTIYLNLQILQSSDSLMTFNYCTGDTLHLFGNTYASTGIFQYVVSNAALNGCDSVYSIDLTVSNTVPTTLSSFSQPSASNACNGVLSLNITGNDPFDVSINGGTPNWNTSGYLNLDSLCPGFENFEIVNSCGDTSNHIVVIPVDSNYVYINPYLSNLALDSLGTTVTNCSINFNSIDTAFIDSLIASGNNITVIWNIVGPNGSTYDTTQYVLNNGPGMYFVQLSIFCPIKAMGDYFTVTQAIYFINGQVYTAGLYDQIGTDFKIYPNPTNGKVTVEFKNDISNMQLVVFDAIGKQVIVKTVQTGDDIELKEFDNGIYYFQFINPEDKSMVLKKVVKQ